MAAQRSRRARGAPTLPAHRIARSERPEAVPQRHVWTCVFLTTAAAVLVRLWFPRAWGEADAPASVFYYGDVRAFLSFAAHLVAGQPFDNGVPFHPPGWPLLLALFFKAAGFAPLDGRPVDPAAIKTFVACLSGLAVGLTTALAARVSGRGAMLAAALLGTFHFGHIVQGTVPNSEALYSLLLVVALLLVIRWQHVESPGRLPLAFVVGAFAGFATLVRAEFMLCALLLATGAVVQGVSPADQARRRATARRRRSAEAGLCLAGFLLLLAPTTIWHWRSISAFNHTRAARLPGPLPRFAPVTSYGAFNFANANHQNADGGFNFDLPALEPQTPEEEEQLDQGQLDLARPAVHRVYVHGYAIGLSWIAAHPGDALRLLWRKAAITSGAFAHGYLQTNVGAGVDGTRRRVDEIDPARRWLWPVHVALVLGGAFLLRRGEHRWLLAAPVVTLAASALLFFGYVRLGVAYLPVFWVLQATALASLADRVAWPAALRRHASGVALAFGLALLAFEAAGQRRLLQVEIEGNAAPDGQLIQDDAVVVRRVR